MPIDIDDRLETERIAKCLKKDPLFRKSLGIKPNYTVIKRVAAIIGLWAIVLIATPLPENLLIGRIGMFVTLAALALCWGVDIVNHRINIDEAADNVAKILRKDPKVKLTSEGDVTTIEHARFTARCNTMTQLELKTMLDMENEVRDAVTSLLNEPRMRMRHQTRPHLEAEDLGPLPEKKKEQA